MSDEVLGKEKKSIKEHSESIITNSEESNPRVERFKKEV